MIIIHIRNKLSIVPHPSHKEQQDTSNKNSKAESKTTNTKQTTVSMTPERNPTLKASEI
jgi:hypothetical protein